MPSNLILLLAVVAIASQASSEMTEKNTIGKVFTSITGID
jgi:hypothetical protein